MRSWQASLIVLASLLSNLALGQDDTKIKLLHADEFKYFDDRTETVRKLIGHVRFKHEDALMFCDSAFMYGSDNKIKAFGHVRMVQGDSLELVGDSLNYNGNTGEAQLRGNITLEDNSQTLYTDYLDYNRKTGVAVYYGGGKLINKKDQSVLTSKQGYYYTASKTLDFKGDVVMDSPEYHIESDTLTYNTEIRKTWFRGPTTITQDSSTIYCLRGWYDQELKRSNFVGDAQIQSESQIMKADSIWYNQITGIGEAFENVVLIDTVQKAKVLSDYSWYNQRIDSSLSTGHLLYAQDMDGDTLFMRADSMITYSDTNKIKHINAYHHVRFFKSDLQGRCDSMTISKADSSIHMYIDPIVWSDVNQITGEHIRMVQFEDALQYMEIDRNAFIASENDSIHYNQIKGKYLIAHFLENELHKIDIAGNGESIYYATEEDTVLIGLNKLKCTNYQILVEDNQVARIKSLVMPTATFYPIEKTTPEILYFHDFIWRDDERPYSMEEL